MCNVAVCIRSDTGRFPVEASEQPEALAAKLEVLGSGTASAVRRGAKCTSSDLGVSLFLDSQMRGNRILISPAATMMEPRNPVSLSTGNQCKELPPTRL
jgi:hypothetical protein